MTEDAFKYDVALSFAGEDREYVAQVAAILERAGVRLFYDEYERVTLWGKDLYVHLQGVYASASRYTVMFISQYYARKLWTNHERQAAQSRAFSERREYILPARFDDTEIPGVLPTIGYIDIREMPAEEFARLILQKLGVSEAPGYEGPPRNEILDLIVRIQSRQPPLAQCVAEALVLATKYDAADLADFCSKELVGYPYPLPESEMTKYSHRAMQAFCTAGELNLTALSYRGSSVFDFIHANRDKFVEKLLFIAESIAQIERKHVEGNKGAWVVRRSVADFNPQAENGDQIVTCYSRPQAYEDIAEGARAELTRRLSTLLAMGRT
jgi:hypothetical protein